MTPESGSAAALGAGGEHRDLIVLDPSVLGPLSADDDPAAPFSFRAQMQWLAGDADALELARAWLHEWQNASAVGPELLPVTPRPRVGPLLADPWLGASEPQATAEAATGSGDAPEGEARATTAAYAASEPPAPYAPGDPANDDPPSDDPPRPPSWKRSPFQLIAILNRVDLASDPCQGFAGELRYVYGAYAPDGVRLLDVTLIIEVPYPATRPAAEWARAWQELAALPPGAAHGRALGALGREIMAESDPLRARLRTNEIAFADSDDPAWEMREFKPQIQDGALVLALAPLELTPRADADPAELSEHVLEHADALETSAVSLPESLRAGAARIESPDFSWPVLGVSERLRRAFSLQTCNGCHGGDTATLPFRHIGPGPSLDAPAELSRFLYDPGAPTDELRRRREVNDALGASHCAPRVSADGYLGG